VKSVFAEIVLPEMPPIEDIRFKIAPELIEVLNKHVPAGVEMLPLPMYDHLRPCDYIGPYMVTWPHYVDSSGCRIRVEARWKT
jgi:hypothetical protein